MVSCGRGEDCAQHLTHRVEKTWRQLHSQSVPPRVDRVGSSGGGPCGPWFRLPHAMGGVKGETGS